ncbi:MAG TPA: GNAT family N-acetyltransferase [Pyrinomonadaceae bacterium]|jgi:predicted GNAT superfamily acetyltransferase|nr:GNAT family N-acetyltransferase [Pyrinomonadaceae bacterium]
MEEIVIRECVALNELDSCIRLQREVFGLPDLEVSPRRHLIVSRQAGGWTLGAFVNERLVGFVHHLAAVRDDEIFGYSHMMAVEPSYQNKGVGARLKWSQRERAIREGRSFIKWTWDPMQARNAHFNLNRLGVTVSSYAENFYGTDYATSPALIGAEPAGIDSDRLFADWQLKAQRVSDLAKGDADAAAGGANKADVTIAIPANWTGLCRENPAAAKQQQLRVRGEFQSALAAGLVAAGFERSVEQPRYLLYNAEELKQRGML